VFSPLSAPSASGPPPSRRTHARRPATVDLELQSGLKFGLAIALALGAVLAVTSIFAAAALVVIAVVMAFRSLLVIGQNPSAPRHVRPREHASWDGTMAALLAVIAVMLVIAAAPLGAAVAGTAAVLLAALRLRTRYVIAR
jgi:hypothetical protein